MIKDKILNILERMPKIELHLHLEGAIPLEALWELIIKYNGTGEVTSIEELKKKFQYSDFPHFIETWIWKNGFIREYEDFTFIASEVARDLEKQNIRYAEMFYSPPDFKRQNLDSRKLTESIVKGFTNVKGNTKINLVIDLVRDFGAQNAMRTLLEINEVKEMGVLGITIGGSEHSFPPDLFKDVFEKARELGFKTSAHAGEAAGSESIWGAVKVLKVDRIGHGTRAFEDKKLIDYLKEKQIPLEMCPLSNVRTAVVKSIEEHPVKDYYRKGLIVFLNTDDPKMFNNSLREEYVMFVDKMCFGLDDVKVLMNNAINSAWCNENDKKALRNELNLYCIQNNLEGTI
jgi:adenosine deaminase